MDANVILPMLLPLAILAGIFAGLSVLGAFTGRSARKRAERAGEGLGGAHRRGEPVLH